MNNVTLIGNLCRETELRQTATGIAVASNTIAVKRDRKEADGSYATDFFDLIIWGNQAEFAGKFLKKGDRVAVSGSIQIRDYTTKQGFKGRAVEVVVANIESLTPKDTEVTEKTEASEQSKNLESLDDIPDEDLPF